MIVSYKEKFKQKIIDGIKKHTLRTKSKRLYKPGGLLHMSTGVRTKNQNMFQRSECKSVQQVEMHLLSQINQLIIIVDGVILHDKTVIEFIKNDGFDFREDFIEWFFSDSKVWEGECIHWTKLKYGF